MTSQDSFRSNLFTNPSFPPTLQENSLGRILRSRFFGDVDRAILADRLPMHEAVLPVLADALADIDLLDGLCCAGSDTHYTRMRLHEGPGYSILAIVWRPEQMSPIHGHKAWCTLGVHQGELVETHLTARPSAKTGRDELHVTGCRQLAAGAVSGSDAHPGDYHRVANLGVGPAVSIHVYGAAFDRLGTDLNRLWPG